MVDRGGLNYPIRVRDEFSKTTQLFRKEIRAAKDEYRAFQKEFGRRSASTTGRQMTETARAAKEQIKAAKTQLAEDKRIARERATAEKAAARARATEQRRSDRERIAAERAVTKAREQQARADNKAGTRAGDRARAAEQKRLKDAILARAAAQTKASKDAEVALKREQKALEEVARAQREREREASAIFKTQQRDAINQITRRAKQQSENEKLAQRQLRAQRAEKKDRDSRNADVQAERAVNKELFRQQVVLKQIALLRKQAASQRSKGDLVGGQASVLRAKQLEKSLVGAASAGNRLLFTFRRLVGTLAIFTLARRGVQAFQDLVGEGIKFNDTIAASQLGIAGLVATLGDVRDAQGQSVSKTEELNLALGIAREQTAKLRQDSLRTVATFQELLETFQVSVGPGLAAGLNLDEVRKLTVDISQAAAALGVPQNQLAEEVRSLLSGTIQARTTRIATALGISNEDVRRLKETGELFTFLEEQFSGFNEAAQKQARETFAGIGTLIKGIVQEILGNAARPLFEELLDLSNSLFDNVLTVRDELGNIRPNPEVVQAFRSIFDALKNAVVAAREIAERIGVGGLQTALGAAGLALDVIVGALQSVLGLVGDILSIITFIREQIGLTAEQSTSVGREVGKWGARLLIANAVLGKFNAKLLQTVKGPAILAAAFFAIAKSLEFILEKIFDIDLNIKDTIELISVGLLSAWYEFSGAIASTAQSISNFFGKAIDNIVSKTKQGTLRARAFVQESVLGDQGAADELNNRAAAEEFALAQRNKARDAQHQLELATIQAETEARIAGAQQASDEIIAARAKANAQGEGFDVTFDANRAAEEAADAAKTFVSTADKPITELGESLAKVTDEIRTAKLEFEQASEASAKGPGGVSSGITSAFDKEAIANAERLRKIRTTLLTTEKEILRLIVTGSNDKGAFNTLLRDEKDLRDAIKVAEEESLRLAGLRAATIAQQVLPSLREEGRDLASQAAAERAKTAAIVQGLGSREQALVAAQSALNLANAELEATERRNALELTALQAQAEKLPPGAELDSINAVIEALKLRQGYEEEILRLRTEQLEKAREEAELAANGSLTDGLRDGFRQFAQEFSSTFQAGVEIARASLSAFTDFASNAIVDAFDPTKEVDIVERFARLMQQIAQVILQQLIQLAIAKAILGFGTSAPLGAVGPTGPVPFTAAKGGRVPEHLTRRAQGFARGGRPSHIPASDTVPAWLTPGEFVLRKSVVDSLGLPLLEAINGGSMPVVGSATAEAAGPSTGMRSGGVVSDTAASGADQQGGGTTVLPVLVADDRKMERLMNGGSNEFMRYAKERAGDLRAILGIKR